MAKVTSDNFTGIRIFGEYGDLSAAEDGKTFAAQPAADTCDLYTISGSSKIIDGHLVNAALGAGVTISVGWRFADGSAGGSATALLPATVCTAAARTNIPVAPFQVDKDIVVYATIGVGAATGRIDFVTKYRAMGTK
jgi:hypothetical protein